MAKTHHAHEVFSDNPQALRGYHLLMGTICIPGQSYTFSLSHTVQIHTDQRKQSQIQLCKF